jgi:D-hexose-6-phosphate mutarotase
MNNASPPDPALAPECSVTFETGQGGLPLVKVATPASVAEVYLHGAHVTHFQRADEPALLFLSSKAVFMDGKPIRGGIPVILPWFGPRAGQPMHGFGRLHAWKLSQIQTLPGRQVRLQFRLPECPEAAGWPPLLADYAVTIGQTLGVELTVQNPDPARPLDLETCLHTYFAVGASDQVEVRGLKGVRYLDSLEGHVQKTQVEDPIRLTSEVDRLYLATPHTVEIVDPSLGRIIRVEKEHSLSTVVWNPWLAKSQRMPDFGNDEYRRMVCVESGNAGPNRLVLPPGASATLRVRLSSHPL